MQLTFIAKEQSQISMLATMVTSWLVSLSLCGFVAAVETDRRPNIPLVFADDLGCKDVGYTGTDFLLRETSDDFTFHHPSTGEVS